MIFSPSPSQAVLVQQINLTYLALSHHKRLTLIQGWRGSKRERLPFGITFMSESRLVCTREFINVSTILYSTIDLRSECCNALANRIRTLNTVGR